MSAEFRLPDEADLSIDAGQTTRILTRFLADEVKRTGRERVVVGLSGGIDSAVAAYLARRALGPDGVICLMMPYTTSSASSVQDARKVLRSLKTPSELIDITPMVDAFGSVSDEADRMRLGNVMARVRMLLLFDRSAKHDALVLGTSNKTELLLGYGTLHGDLASALNPIGDLYKTQVRELGRYLRIPKSIQTKPPSADLYPDQSDEEDLGFRYEEVDRLLALLVEARVREETAVEAGFSRAMVRRVMRSIVGSQFKRRPPVIAKLSGRSVGWDFRYPRDWMT